MEKMTGKPEPQMACRHLGLADNPFDHSDTATEDHRCYLWMQRDLIDLDHQKGYCLSERFRGCPWLHISLPCQPKFKEVWQEAVVCTFSDTGRRIWPRICAAASVASLVAKAGAISLALWARDNLPKALSLLRRELPSLAGAAARNIGRGGGRLAGTFASLRNRPKTTPPPAAPAEGADFAMLMRLGRECSKAGNRQQAHLCFTQASSIDPASEDAWLWVAATAEDAGKAMDCLAKALAINPASGRARAQLADVAKPAPRTRAGKATARTEVTAPRLVKKGIAALDAGSEDEAYQLFTTATEADQTNESAWFWRAKTATDLNEVIMCLQHVLDLNPQNEKARASLTWATDRQKSSATRRAIRPPEPRPIVPALYFQAKPAPRSALLHISSTIYMVIGILWVAPVVIPGFGGIISSIYDSIGILPALKMPYLPSSWVFSDSPYPEVNLLYGVPLLVAVLSFVAMETVWDERTGASLYLALVAVVSIFTIGIFGSLSTPSAVISIMSTAAGVLGLAGRITHRKQTKSRLARRGTSTMTGLTRTT